MTFVTSIAKKVSAAFLIAIVLIVLLTRYVKKQLAIINASQKEQKFYSENVQTRFQQNQRDCQTTTLALTLTVDKKIRESSFVVEECTSALQEISRKKLLTSEEKNKKIDLWNQLKIVGLSRTITSLYALAVIHLFNRVQVSMLGRIKYVGSVLEYGELEREPIEPELEKSILSLNWHIINSSIPRIYQLVKAFIVKELEDVTLKTIFSLEMLTELFDQTKTAFDTIELCELFLDSDAISKFNASEGAISEIEDIIRNPDFKALLNTSIKACFETFYESLAHHFQNTSRSQPLASMIPIICHQYRFILAGDENVYVEKLSKLNEIMAFSAIIYSSQSYV